MLYVLKMFGISALLTWLIELPVGWVMGLRGRKYIYLMLLVNLLTNPAAVLLHFLGIPQLPIEIGVVLAETLVYLWFSKDENWIIRHPVWLAVVTNGISWTTGILIQM